MKKLFLLLFSLSVPLFSQWQMFSDKTDTYIYNTTTGEIYIRHKMNGKNYEDVFVRMPKGIIPKSTETSSIHKDSNTKQNDDTALEAIKKANEIMNRSIDGGL